MNTELLVPTLGESITEATVSKWLKNIGDSFEADEPLVEIETDKITVEVPAPHAGSLKEIKVKEGSDVEIGGILGIIDEIKGKNHESPKKQNEINELKSKPSQEKNQTINLPGLITGDHRVVECAHAVVAMALGGALELANDECRGGHSVVKRMMGLAGVDVPKR